MGKKKQTVHVQCRLRRVNGVETTSWLPKWYAVKGKFLKLKTDAGEWENGWEVVDTFGTMTSDEVRERSQDYKHQREASDI